MAPPFSGRPTGTRWPGRRSATRARSWRWSPRATGTSPRMRRPSSRSITTRSRWPRTRARRTGTMPRSSTPTRRTTCCSAPSGRPGRGNGNGSSGRRSASASRAATPASPACPWKGAARWPRTTGRTGPSSSTPPPRCPISCGTGSRAASGSHRAGSGSSPRTSGGGFGPKMQLLPEEVAAAALAMRLGRPVKWVQDRMEHLQSAFHSRDNRRRGGGGGRIRRPHRRHPGTGAQRRRGVLVLPARLLARPADGGGRAPPDRTACRTTTTRASQSPPTGFRPGRTAGWGSPSDRS